jgi:hypothetical protein
MVGDFTRDESSLACTTISTIENKCKVHLYRHSPAFHLVIAFPMKLHVPLSFGLSLAHSFNLSSAGVCVDGDSMRMSFVDAVQKDHHLRPSKHHSLADSESLNDAIPPQSIVGGTEVRLETSHAFLFLFMPACSSIDTR